MRFAAAELAGGDDEVEVLGGQGDEGQVVGQGGGLARDSRVGQACRDGEMARLVAIAVQRLGITEVRFTGGEPLLRRGLAGLIAAAAALRPRPEISLTTNGIGLARLAGPLRDAGLDRINVSLDTLSPETFVTLARRDRLADVLAGLSAAAAAGLAPVKVNAVLMRGVNDHEAAALLRFCLDRGYQLRFIEQMPLDAQHGWRRTDMITAEKILAALSARFSLTPADPAGRRSAPAETFLVDDGPDKVGVIGSVTRPFCGACDRVRLTADGQIRNCLFARSESDLRTPLRAGADDDQLAAIWRRAVATKLPGHGINDHGSCSPPGRCQPSAADRRAMPSSPGGRTVDWYLREVFAKLDISSRRKLGQALRRRSIRS